MYCDSHAHLDEPRFDEDREQIIEDLRNHEVGLIVNIGCDLPSSENSVALAEKYPFIYAAVGSHPDDAANVNGKLLDRYRKLAEHKKVVAIGEIGLDYYYEEVPRAQQISAFEQQMDLAEALDLPVVVHMRDATEDALAVVEHHPKITGVFHCFSGSVETAKWLLDRGWYIGFTGVITFKNARRAVEVAKFLPADRILTETDCPYMAPEPHRGHRNDSRYVPLVAAKIGEIKGISPEEAGRITTENARRFFRIPTP